MACRSGSDLGADSLSGVWSAYGCSCRSRSLECRVRRAKLEEQKTGKEDIEVVVALERGGSVEMVD